MRNSVAKQPCNFDRPSNEKRESSYMLNSLARYQTLGDQHYAVAVALRRLRHE